MARETNRKKSSARSSSSRSSSSSSRKKKSSSSSSSSRKRSSGSSRRSSGGRDKDKRKRSKKKKGEAPKRHWFVRLLRVLLVLIALGTFLGAVTVAGALWYYSRDLPEVFTVDDYVPKQVTRVYDRNGLLIAELGEERRTVVPLSDIPVEMRQAIVAAEDGNFYDHEGLDYFGVVRAAYTNIQRGSYSQGASTLTQQVVKNLLLTPERTIRRKVQEVLLARRIEKQLTKDEILWIYLNHVYFGHGNYGVEEASRYFFNKHVAELTVVEAATLAGLVQSPERLSPVKHPERSLERRNYVLRRMNELSFIDDATYADVIEKPIPLNRKTSPTLGKAPYFAEDVRKMLIDRYGRDFVYTTGLEVHTTLDLKLQLEAKDALQRGLIDYDGRHGHFRVKKTLDEAGIKKARGKSAKSGCSEVSCLPRKDALDGVVTKVTKDVATVAVGGIEAPLELIPLRRFNPEDKPLPELLKRGDVISVVPHTEKTEKGKKAVFWPASSADAALIAIDPRTREVVAMVGGFDWDLSSFNRATQAKRQTGSSFKPIVYSAAINSRIASPATVMSDSPKVFHIPGKREPWSPKNFDKKYKGDMRLRTALALSRNTIAVELLERVGIEPTIAYAKSLGMVSDVTPNFTMALGTSEATAIEMANVFSTFASGGWEAEPIFIRKVVTPTGDVLDEADTERHRVISEEVAFLTTSMMRSVATEGTAKKHLKNWEHYAVGKTGTTDGPKDAWFVGYTSYYVTAVYVGFDAPTPLGSKEGGGKTALPIWADFMKRAHAELEPRPFEPPTGVVTASIDKSTGMLAQPDARSSMTEYFLPGTVPTQFALGSDEQADVDWTMDQIGTTRTLPRDGGAATGGGGDSASEPDDDDSGESDASVDVKKRVVPRGTGKTMDDGF